MNIVQAHNTFRQKIMHLRSRERITRIRLMAWMMAGLLCRRSIHLSEIANAIPGQAKRWSNTKRLARFLDNKHVQVRQWYEPIAQYLLKTASKTPWVRLVIDCSKVGHGHQLCMVAVAFRRRALPIVWTWLRTKRGHSRAMCNVRCWTMSLS